VLQFKNVYLVILINLEFFSQSQKFVKDAAAVKYKHKGKQNIEKKKRRSLIFLNAHLDKIEALHHRQISGNQFGEVEIISMWTICY